MNKQIQKIIENFDFNAINQDDLNKEHMNSIIDAILEQDVNMGLPSGTLWCDHNIGAKCIEYTGEWSDEIVKSWYGDYFAWGEIKPKSKYTWETYKWTGDANSTVRSKYLKKYGCPYFTSKTVLESQDDAAYMNTKGLYRMPTVEQFDELIKYCDVTHVHHYKGVNGLHGRLFTSKINGKTLFFPNAECKVDDETEHFNAFANSSNLCWYWSASATDMGGFCSNRLPEALTIYEEHETYIFTLSKNHMIGMPVRGVRIRI